MKKIAFSLVAMIFFLAMALVFTPRPVIGGAAPSAPGTELADSIQKFVQRACMDCHSDDGSSMARSKVNFNKWGTYDAAKQAKKANAMVKQLTKGRMPTKKWRENNPNDIPSKTEADMVGAWAKSIQK